MAFTYPGFPFFFLLLPNFAMNNQEMIFPRLLRVMAFFSVKAGPLSGRMAFQEIHCLGFGPSPLGQWLNSVLGQAVELTILLFLSGTGS